MRGRGGGAALAASPVLVGAVTVLVTIVAVFLSYNANSGLPFVPTYDLKANLPNAAQLVDGFEVRIGGARVGVISDIAAKRRDDGTSYAQVTMKLDKQIEPLPEGSTLLVRPRSAVGLKYIELTPGGRGGPDLEPGSTIPVRQVRTPVELDEFFGMFDDKARVGSRNSLDGYGGGLAGRGQDLNTAIAAFVPLVEDAEPVLRNLSDPQTKLARFFRSLADTATEVAPVAEQQASLFVSLDTSFTALASVARPFIQETISESPPTEELAIRDFPVQRPFLRNNAAFFKELRPGVATLPHSAPILADAFVTGTNVLPKTIPANEDLSDVFNTLADFSEDPVVRTGVQQLTRLASSLRPDAEFPHAGPDDLQLRDPVVPQRRQPALRRRRHRHLAALPVGGGPGRHERPAHGRPARVRQEQRGPAVGAPSPTGHSPGTTCTSTPTRTRPRPARVSPSARPGTSPGARTSPRSATRPGNQGTKTAGQVKKK